jgi:hypothetical protein
MAMNDKNNEKLGLGENHEGSPDSPESKKYKQEKKELLDGLRKEKAELLHEIEQDESHRDATAAQEFMRHNDAPEMNSGPDSPEYQELRKIFESLTTDHIQYPFRRLFPNFVRVAESTKLGNNIPADVLFLALGIAESLVSVIKLSGHFLIDTARLVIRPRKTYRETREFM